MLVFRVWIIALTICGLIGSAGCGSKEEPNNGVPLKSEIPGLPGITMKQISVNHSAKSIYIRHKANKSSGPTKTQSLTHSASNDPDKRIRGIYVSGWVAGNVKRINQLIELIDQTDLNAMVIDVKNDYGKLTYRSKLPQIKSIGADSKPVISNVRQLLRKLKRNNIYVIGRIVTFKDPLFAHKYPTMALQARSGGVWHDSHGHSWLNPYQPAVRSYNQSIAAEAAAIGFDEIQFDYVRFPDNEVMVDKEVHYSLRNNKTKQQIISQFLRESRALIHKTGAKVSADVFGLVTSSKDDMGIGQSWNDIASSVDVISPMTYPSHYSTGIYGVKQPDLAPAAIIGHAMKDAQKHNGYIRRKGKRPADIRPWLQSFTATWLHPHQRYNTEQVHKQIEAAKAQGVKQFLLWSPNCKYDYRS